MKKSALKIYSLAICLLSAAIIVMALAVAGYDLRRIFRPEATISSTLGEKHQAIRRLLDDWPKDQPLPQDQNIFSHDEKAHQEELEKEQLGGFQGLKRDLIVLCIAVVILFFHWKIMKRATVPFKAKS